MATRTCASAVDAPRCGVRTVLGASSSGESRGGSEAKTSTPAPPSRPSRSASARAASSTIPPRATLRTIAPGRMVAMAAASSRLRVVRVSGTCRVSTSQRAITSARSKSATPWFAAASAVTNGSWPMTSISIARARSAMAMPILPRPTMPRVLPRNSTPVKAPRFHSPRRSEASAAAMRRATAYSSASVCSAAAIVLPVGALTTVTPARVAASRSTLSTPTPARPTTISRVAAARAGASSCTWLRTRIAS